MLGFVHEHADVGAELHVGREQPPAAGRAGPATSPKKYFVGDGASPPELLSAGPATSPRKYFVGDGAASLARKYVLAPHTRDAEVWHWYQKAFASFWSVKEEAQAQAQGASATSAVVAAPVVELASTVLRGALDCAKLDGWARTHLGTAGKVLQGVKGWLG